MHRSLRLAHRTLVVIAITFAAGCAATSAAEPASQPTPSAPRPVPESNCKTDADCPSGQVCQAHIFSLCDTCDGGPMVQTCETH